MKPQFISIEGLEGAGKTTQAEELCRWLDKKSIQYIRTREPGGTEIAEEIRELVLKHHEEKLDPVAELLLVFAARKQHVEQLIKPTLANGTWVVSDRFTDATYAYQGGGREIDTQVISNIENIALEGFQPDTTFWFDCDAETGLSRARARGELDRIEAEATDFFDRCRAAYKERANEQPSRFLKLNAGQSIDKVTQDMIQLLETRYG